MKRFSSLFGAASFVATLAIGIVSQGAVFAAACTAPTADLGSVTMSVDIPADATYTVWTRMIAPDATNNSVDLEIDGNDCYNVGGGTFAETAWTTTGSNWVNYANGTPSTPLTKALTTGAHTLKFIGTKAGVGVDRVVVSSDTACTPLGVGDNCQSGDSTPPTVSMVTPTANENVTGTIDLTATATDASGIQDVKFLVDGQVVGSDATDPYSFSWNSAGVQNGTHTVAAQATDTSGTSATSSPVAIVTNNSSVCTDPPSVPDGLTVSGTTASSVSLSWTASTPGASCSIKEYHIFRDGAQVASAPDVTYDDTGLQPAQTFSYTVTAVDTTGHESAQSTAVTGTTSTDSQAPTTPTNVHSTLVASDSIALAWDASTDNNAVTDYVITRNGTQVGTSQTASFSDSGLSPSTEYTYTVVAKDAAGNASQPSVAAVISTIAGGGGGGDNSMFVDPVGGTYNVGDTVTVTIKENSNTDPINGVQADLKYSKDTLEFQSFDTGSSAFSVEADKKAADGAITMTRGTIDPVTGEKEIVKVNFKAIAAGTATVEVATTSVLASSVTANTNVLSRFEGSAYTIGTTTTPPPTTPPPTTPPPTTPPVRPPVTPPVTPPVNKPITTTTISPTGNPNPLPLTGGSEIELSDPAVIQTSTTGSSSIKKVEYWLNGKRVHIATQAPFSYSVDTTKLRNGRYTLLTKTFYSSGKIDSKTTTINVKNPLNFAQLMLQLRHYAWILVILALVAGGAIWFLFFKKQPDDEFSGDPGMYDDGMGGGGFGGPTDGSGPPPPADPYAGGGGAPPAAGGDPYGRY